MTILINSSFEIGYDVTIIDNYENKIIMNNNTIDIYDINELLDYIKDIIQIYEEEQYDKEN